MFDETLPMIPGFNIGQKSGESKQAKKSTSEKAHSDNKPLFGEKYNPNLKDIQPLTPGLNANTEPEETITLIPGLMLKAYEDVEAAAARSPRSRFAKAGENANHPHTEKMRVIKDALGLTTTQLVKELNAYEKEHQAANFHRSPDQHTPSWLPMTSVLMASYLQGWVIQESFMAQVAKRLENLYQHKAQQGEVRPQKDIRSIMDGWYKTLGIDASDPNNSPTRTLARLIAPFYKRPVLAAISGIFQLGMTTDEGQIFSITDSKKVVHHFTLNPNEPVLVEDGKKISEGDVIQYSVLMQTQKAGDKVILTHEPSINHTTFYRWYANNKMPRSIITLELVEAAVNEAAKLTKKVK